MRRSRKRHRPLEERAIRTRMLRDTALATGKTCIACGDEAVTRVGPYPACERHRHTVHAPHPNKHWKENVRRHHRRIRRRICVRCGRKRGLTRHHDWRTGQPGRPPKPIVLCRRCHDAIEREQAVRVIRSGSSDTSSGSVDRIDRFT